MHPCGAHISLESHGSGLKHVTSDRFDPDGRSPSVLGGLRYS